MSREAILAIARELDRGAIAPPYAPLSLRGKVPDEQVAPLAIELLRWSRLGMGTGAMAEMLRLLAAERERTEEALQRIQLVWSGPDARGSHHRATAVAVKECFDSAEQSLLLAGFAVHQGVTIFERLAERMALLPDLRVRLCLNIHHDSRFPDPREAVRRFGEVFRRHHWPPDIRLPELYYFPRSLDPDETHRGVMHAKCIVVDRRVAFVSSANFTEAAQVRNIEVGVRIADPDIAADLERHFDYLIRQGELCRVLLN